MPPVWLPPVPLSLRLCWCGTTLMAVSELDRRIAKLAIPALGSIAAEPLYTLADTAIVGHLGRGPLDALAIAASALSMMAWLAIFLSTATTTEVARKAARGERQPAARAVGAAYCVAAAWGAVTLVVVVIAAPYAAWLLGGRGSIGSAATTYIRISAIGLPFLYLSYAGNGHLTGLEDTTTPLRIAVGANVLNVGLEAALVFGLHAGLAGSAWGTVAAQVAAAAGYARASRRAALAPARPARADIAALLGDGHRLSVRTIALGVVPLAVTAVAARLGPVPLAGQQIATRVWYLLSLSLDAFAVPAQVYVSAALGTGDREAARLAARRTLALGLAAGTVLAALTAALAFIVPPAFTADRAVRHVAFIGLLCAALTQPLAALAYVYDGIILGLGDYAAMRRAMIGAIVAFVPLAALVLRFHWLGLPGVWAALGCWLAARSVLLARRWARAERRGPAQAALLALHEALLALHEDADAEPVRAAGSAALAAAAVRVGVGRAEMPGSAVAEPALGERVSLKRPVVTDDKDDKDDDDDDHVNRSRRYRDGQRDRKATC
jgi:putative MATE family efflux protein